MNIIFNWFFFTLLKVTEWSHFREPKVSFFRKFPFWEEKIPFYPFRTLLWVSYAFWLESHFSSYMSNMENCKYIIHLLVLLNQIVCTMYMYNVVNVYFWSSFFQLWRYFGHGQPELIYNEETSINLA